MLPHSLALVAFLAVCVSANIHLTVDTDVRRVIDLGVFGFNNNGVIQLQVHEFFISDPTKFLDNDGRITPNEPIGFVLELTSSAQSARAEKNYARTEGAEQRKCLIKDEKLAPADITTRHIFPLDGKTLKELANTTYSANIAHPGLYALFFYNCKGFADSAAELQPIPVTFTALATLYYLDENGGRNYLSYGERNLPLVFFMFALLFFLAAFVWMKMLMQQQQFIHKVHTMMLFLLLVKALSLGFEGVKYMHFNATGHPSVWDVFFYVLMTIKGVTLFGVLLLLGSGWSVMKAFLSDQDKKIMMVILPSQVLINISLAIIEESSEGTKNWSSWADLLQILDVICCCCVLLPIVWSIKNLRDVAQNDDKAARTISRMRKFRTFYIIVVAYIYFTRIVVVMIENSLSFDNVWLSKVAREVAALVFYVYTGWKFRPMMENPYLQVDHDENEMDARKEVA
jgi:hypothetical protein